MRRVLSGILFACAGACATCGQTPLKGVVWDHAAPPTMDELVAMRAAGIEAVRLPLMTDLDLYSSADTVGLALFQDLPYAFLAARALDDQYLEARTELLKALVLGSGHPSSKHYGLAVLSDTSDPDACTFMARLAASIRAVQGARSYYVSAFPAHDQCAEHVDLVLLEARNDPDPTRLINEWPAATAVGIGALGVLRRPDVYGLSQPDSPQSQARYLETHLTSLMQSPAAAVFVYRWQDPAGTRAVLGPYRTRRRIQPRIFGHARHLYRPSACVCLRCRNRHLATVLPGDCSWAGVRWRWAFSP